MAEEVCFKKTDVVTIESPVTYAAKIRNSVAVCMNNEMLFFAPFSRNRGFTGTHYAKYAQSAKIDSISYMISNATLSNSAACMPLDDIPESSLPKEKFLIVLDVNNEFHIIDVARAFEVCKFRIPDIPRVLSFCGSITTMNQLAVVSNTGLRIYHVNQDGATFIQEISASIRTVMPYKSSYLICNTQSIAFVDVRTENEYKPTSVEINSIPYFVSSSPDPICSMRVDGDDVVFVQEIKAQKQYMISCANGQQGIKKLLPDVWDITCGWFFGLLKDNLLVVINVSDVNRKRAYNLDTTIEPMYLFAGNMPQNRAFGILIIGSKVAETYEIPYEVLNEI